MYQSRNSVSFGIGNNLGMPIGMENIHNLVWGVNNDSSLQHKHKRYGTAHGSMLTVDTYKMGKMIPFDRHEI